MAGLGRFLTVGGLTQALQRGVLVVVDYLSVVEGVLQGGQAFIEILFRADFLQQRAAGLVPEGFAEGVAEVRQVAAGQRLRGLEQELEALGGFHLHRGAAGDAPVEAGGFEGNGRFR